MDSWFGPPNQAGYGLSVAPQNQREDDLARGTRRDSARGTRRDLAACFA
jgi:hypothetical protein